MAVIYTVAYLVPNNLNNCENHSDQPYIFDVRYNCRISNAREANVLKEGCRNFHCYMCVVWQCDQLCEKEIECPSKRICFPPVFILLISCDLSIVGTPNHNPQQIRRKKWKLFYSYLTSRYVWASPPNFGSKKTLGQLLERESGNVCFGTLQETRVRLSKLLAVHVTQSKEQVHVSSLF